MALYTPPGYEWARVEPRVITTGPDCYPWRKTMALWPVKTISGRWVWRQEVYVRRVWLDYNDGRVDTAIQYCELFDLLKSE